MAKTGQGGGRGVSAGGRRARSVSAVTRALAGGQEVSYRGDNGKSYRAVVEMRGGVSHLTIRGSGSNRRLTSRVLGRDFTIEQVALSIMS